MIPNIEQICEDLAAGRITVQQAIEWLHLHMGMAELRDNFAMAALSGFIARHAGLPTSLPMKSDAAERAYAFADAMLAERAKA